MAELAELQSYRLVEKHASWTQGGPVVSRLPDQEIDQLAGRTTATIGEAHTLALFGLATGTWMAGVVFGGFLVPSAQVALAPVLILFAGVAQFIGGLYAFRRADALGANAFCCYGAYYAVVGVILLLAASGMIAANAGTDTMLGYLNCSFGFISLALMIAALRRNLVLTGLLGALTAGFTLIGIGLFNVQPGGGLGAVAIAGAALLFLAALLAYYLGMAMVVNSSWKRTILPVIGEP